MGWPTPPISSWSSPGAKTSTTAVSSSSFNRGGCIAFAYFEASLSFPPKNQFLWSTKHLVTNNFPLPSYSLLIEFCNKEKKGDQRWPSALLRFPLLLDPLLQSSTVLLNNPQGFVFPFYQCPFFFTWLHKLLVSLPQASKCSHFATFHPTFCFAVETWMLATMGLNW